MNDQSTAQVPPDFPRRCEGSLSGVQPKLAVRLSGGKFISGWTSEELVARYDACEDLVRQLIELAKRKRGQYAELPLKEFLRRLAKGVVNKGWDLDDRELAWVMLQVAVGMGGGPADAPGSLVEVSVRASTSTAHITIPSLVDVAMAGSPSATTRSGEK